VIFYEIYISSEGFMWMFPCTGPCNVDRKAESSNNVTHSQTQTDYMNVFTTLRSLILISTRSAF